MTLSSCQAQIAAQAAAAAPVAAALHQLEHRVAAGEGRLQQLHERVERQAGAASSAEEEWKVRALVMS
jgi:hypothetical protein